MAAAYRCFAALVIVIWAVHLPAAVEIIDDFSGPTLDPAWSAPLISSNTPDTPGSLLIDAASHPGELALSAEAWYGTQTIFSLVRTGINLPVGRALSLKLRMEDVPAGNGVGDDFVTAGVMLADTLSLSNKVALYAMNETRINLNINDRWQHFPNSHTTGQRVEFLFMRDDANTYRFGYRIDDGPLVVVGLPYAVGDNDPPIGSVCAIVLNWDERVGKATGRVLYDRLAIVDDPGFPAYEPPPMTILGWKNQVDFSKPDGGFAPVAGVHNIQVFRATRGAPELADDLGWTYHHHLDLAHWRGKFYLAWTTNPVNEDQLPARLLFSTSADGFTWSKAADYFPRDSGGSERFYFYKASNGRMLALARYKHVADGNERYIIGSLIARELRPDGSFGNEIYTIIPTSEALPFPPPYTESPDAGFVQACQEAYDNRPLLEQLDYGLLLGDRKMIWHNAAAWPGGVMGNINGYPFGKALCFFHRKDGKLVGVCKQGWVTLSEDEGLTWSMPVVPPTLIASSAKVWGQKTSDGRYALVYNPHLSIRYPLLLTRGDDGITFGELRTIHGEVPQQRYAGGAKDTGAQYVRGIAEWSYDAPPADDALWVAYSVHKEDIWISRIPVPEWVPTHADDDFESAAPGSFVPGWNVYNPLWAAVRIVNEPDTDTENCCLLLEDRDPYDYARAQRLFPASNRVWLEFRIQPQQISAGRLEMEALAGGGERSFLLALTEQGRIEFSGAAATLDLGAYASGRWIHVGIGLDLTREQCTVLIDGNRVLSDALLTTNVSAVGRLSFRSGPYRGVAPLQEVSAASDVPQEAVRNLIDDVRTSITTSAEIINYE